MMRSPSDSLTPECFWKYSIRAGRSKVVYSSAPACLKAKDTCRVISGAIPSRLGSTNSSRAVRCSAVISSSYSVPRREFLGMVLPVVRQVHLLSFVRRRRGEQGIRLGLVARGDEVVG